MISGIHALHLIVVVQNRMNFTLAQHSELSGDLEAVIELEKVDQGDTAMMKLKVADLQLAVAELQKENTQVRLAAGELAQFPDRPSVVAENGLKAAVADLQKENRTKENALQATLQELKAAVATLQQQSTKHQAAAEALAKENSQLQVTTATLVKENMRLNLITGVRLACCGPWSQLTCCRVVENTFTVGQSGKDTTLRYIGDTVVVVSRKLTLKVKSTVTATATCVAKLSTVGLNTNVYIAVDGKQVSVDSAGKNHAQVYTDISEQSVPMAAIGLAELEAGDHTIELRAFGAQDNKVDDPAMIVHVF